MKLPLIDKIKNDLGFIDKNFRNINRYKSFFNKLNLAQSSNSTIDSKINLLNSNNSSDNKKSDQFNSKSRNTFNKKLLNDIFITITIINQIYLIIIFLYQIQEIIVDLI